MDSETPNYAGFGIRLYAYFIDQSIIQAVALLFLAPYLYFKRSVIDTAMTQYMSMMNPAGLGEMQDFNGSSQELLIFVVEILIIYIALIIVIGLLYGSLLESSDRGATLGKRYCKLRVTTLYGEPITLGSAIIRNIGVNLPAVIMNFDLLLTFIVSLSYLTPLMTKMRQTIYDMAAQTVVIKEE